MIKCKICNKEFKSYQGLSRHIRTSAQKDEVHPSNTKEYYDIYQQFYPEGNKSIKNVSKLTPLSVLHWYIGDGGLYGKGKIIFQTMSFNDKENKKLRLMLRKIGVRAYIQEITDHKTGKEYPSLQITTHRSIKRLFEYISKAPTDELLTVKRLFPWKFVPFLRKTDVKKGL